MTPYVGRTCLVITAVKSTNVLVLVTLFKIIALLVGVVDNCQFYGLCALSSCATVTRLAGSISITSSWTARTELALNSINFTCLTSM